MKSPPLVKTTRGRGRSGGPQGKTRRIILCFTALIIWGFFITHADAAGKPTSKEIYLYQGADRDRQLAEKAKKEGTVTFYSTLTVKDANTLIEAFEKKYGVKVVLWRANQDKLVQRALAETRAGRQEVDILETDGAHMEMLYREKILEQFYSPAFKDIPAIAFPKHKHYVADRFAFFVTAYNTKLVKPEDVPNSYEDLLQPK